MKLILIAFFISSFSHAWTLNNNFGASFKNDKVKVYVDETTVCPTNGLTVDELESLVKPAVDDFWNRVPTSALELKASGFSAATQSINNGRLCSPTDDACIADGTTNGNLIPAVNDIIIACNDNNSNFGGGNVLAVTIPNKFSGKSIAGAVILINDVSNTFGNLSRSDQISVIAHEIGHAIGLGHSKDDEALMYYRTVDQRSRLGQDDVDGVSFLYPVHGDAYGLCGTVTTTNPPGNPPLFQMGIAFGLMILIYELLRRAKRRSTF